MALKALPLIQVLELLHLSHILLIKNVIMIELKGKGLYLDTHQGKSIRDFMKNAIDDAADITDDVKKHFKSTIKNGSFTEFKDGKLSFKFI